jgi:hypothetical protein
MTFMQSIGVFELGPTVDRLHAKYGLLRILWALMLAAHKRRRDRRAIGRIPNYVRRDIGLPERDEEPVILWIGFWDNRL